VSIAVVWSCRACRPPPARDGPAARARPAIAGRSLRRAPASRIASTKRIAARDDVAHDVEVGVQRELLGAVAFDQLDAQRTQLGRSSAGRRWRRSRSPDGRSRGPALRGHP
jgi:hypothetical protein